ncbi:hypothetical protein FDUTEX481_01469 [Tolypothrix sp. PCC 7601]|nr:hypothetical protein FDUTEX481_01469 [Tolypothrix sp. PCC 7601]
MLGGGWVKVKGKRVMDKNLSPLPNFAGLQDPRLLKEVGDLTPHQFSSLLRSPTRFN